MPIPEAKRNTNGFDKNPQNINKKGRPLKIYNIIKNLGYSKDDFLAVFSELPFYTIPQLKRIAVKKDTPAIVIVVAMALRKAIESNDYRAIREIIEYTVGKPQQEIKTASETSLNIIVDNKEQKDKIDEMINGLT